MISFVVARGRVLLSAHIRPSGRSLSGQQLVAILLAVLRLPGQRPTTNARRLGGEQPRPAASKGARRAVRVTGGFEQVNEQRWHAQEEARVCQRCGSRLAFDAPVVHQH